MNESLIYLKSGITFINDKCKCNVNWINGHGDTLNVNESVHHTCCHDDYMHKYVGAEE